MGQRRTNSSLLAGALTVAPVLVLWAPEVPPGPSLLYYNQSQWLCTPLALQAAGCAGGGVMEETPTLLGINLTTTLISVVDWCPNH